jgi:hypothetical protein
MPSSIYFAAIVVVIGIVLAVLITPILLIPVVLIALIGLFGGAALSALGRSGIQRGRPGHTTSTPSSEEASYDPTDDPTGAAPRG